MNLFEGYKPIAVRDNRWGLSVISYHPEKKLFLLVIDRKPAGPFTRMELEGLHENIKDVLNLRGHHLYIDGFTATGEKIDDGSA